MALKCNMTFSKLFLLLDTFLEFYIIHIDKYLKDILNYIKYISITHCINFQTVYIVCSISLY